MIVPAKKAACLVDRLVTGLSLVLLALEVPPLAIEQEIGAVRSSPIGSINSRRVVGSGNELVFQLEHQLAFRPNLTLLEHAVRLAETPMSLIESCLAACRRLGAAVAEHEPVIGIPVTAGRVAGVETERRSISAPVVVDAAGGWVRQVAELAGVSVPLAPVRHQLLITGPTAQVDPDDPIARVVDAAVYLRPARGGLMVGGFEPDPLPVDLREQSVSFSTDDLPLDLGVLRRMADQVAAEVPAAVTAPVAEHRGGLFTMSPDGRFVAGPVPDLPGLWVASGCNGSGFSSSLALGEALASWITTGAPPPGMEAFSPGRFAPLPDDALVSRGLWQYAHYYDPVLAPTA